MICQQFIARCYRVYQHERNENASFLSIFNGVERPKWRFSNFPRFWKNSSALGSFSCIFEDNSLKALLGQNIKKLKILKLSQDYRYLQKLALKSPTNNYKISESQLEMKKRYKRNGFRLLISNDYDKIISILNTYMHKLRVPCHYCSKQFLSNDTYQIHLQSFHKL